MSENIEPIPMGIALGSASGPGYPMKTCVLTDSLESRVVLGQRLQCMWLSFIDYVHCLTVLDNHWEYA